MVITCQYTLQKVPTLSFTRIIARMHSDHSMFESASLALTQPLKLLLDPRSKVLGAIRSQEHGKARRLDLGLFARKYNVARPLIHV